MSLQYAPPPDPFHALLGAWGLGVTDLPAALAGAGVLAARWRRLKPQLDGGVADLGSHLEDALTVVERGQPVPWRDPFTRSGWRRHELGIDASRLAAAWRDAVGASSRGTGQGPDEPVRITIEADDEFARRWPLPRLSTMLARADWRMAAAIERARRPGRVHWDWPLGLGVPPTPEGTALLDGLELLTSQAGEAWLAATTRPRSLRGRTTTSLLVLPGEPDGWAPWVVRARPSAEVALVLCDTTEQLERAMELLLPQRDLRAVAGVLARDRVDTLRGVVRELTHDESLDIALAHSGDDGEARYVVHADPAALVQLRLRHTMRRTSALLAEVAGFAEEAVADSDDADSTADSDDADSDDADSDGGMDGIAPTATPRRSPTAPRRRSPSSARPPAEPLLMAAPPDVAREVARLAPRLEDTSERLAHLADDGLLLREIDGAVPLSEETDATRELVEDAGPVRHVHARVRDDGGEVVDHFVADVVHSVTVFVGPSEQDAVRAPAPFPDEQLEPDRSHRLTVVLACPDLDPAVQVDTITLPPAGRSDDAQFSVRPPTRRDRLEARIIVLHDNRVLQSWMLTGSVVAGTSGATPPADASRVALEVEAVVRARTSDLHRRQPYDAAVVVNHDHTRRARATVVGGDGGAQVDLDAPALRDALDDIVAALDVAVEDVEDHDSLDDEPMRELLVLLANRGSMLRDAIVEQMPDIPDAHTAGPRRLQVLSARAEAFLPLELLYDPPAPGIDATVCEDGRAVLAADTGDPCPAQHDRTVVCPIGFWGLNSVIERHTWSSGALDRGWRVSDEPTDGRDVIRLRGPVLVGASHRVDAVARGTTKQTMDRIERIVATTGVHTWQEWVDVIAADAPDLLVALPHTVKHDLLGPSLTIGTKADEDAPLGSAHIDTEHVRTTDDGHTVVVLLGCETADTTIPFLQFPAAFRRARAQVVLGTLTRVVGRHAGPLAAELATQLLAPPGGATTMGAALRDLRRRHLDGFGPVVLALVAYGDADWIIEGDEGAG